LVLNLPNNGKMCQLCFLYEAWDESRSYKLKDAIKVVARGKKFDSSELCFDCNHGVSDPHEYVCEVVALVYCLARDRFDEVVKLFKVKDPYDMLLKKFEHTWDPGHSFCDHPVMKGCPVIIGLIDKLTNLDNSYWISNYNSDYINYFIRKGCKIDLPEIVIKYLTRENSVRLDKVVKLCDTKDAFNHKHIDQLCGHFYGRVRDLKHLVKLGLNFENHYLSECGKMFYDIPIGKLYLAELN